VSRPPLHETSPQTRKTGQARAARDRLPLVWLVVAGSIAAVFVLVFLLAFLL
jgi:hypothetical protein